jgi:Transcriptional regulators
MKEHDMVIAEDYRYRFDGFFTVESGYQAAQKFMGMDEKPTAIIAMNNMTGIGILKYLRSKNIKVPDDVSLAVFGEIENAEIIYVNPTIVALNPNMIGTKSIEMLLSRIKSHNNTNYREILYVPQLVVCESTQSI